METQISPKLDPSDEYNTKLSIIEISPVLIPYILGFFIFRGFYSNFPLYLQIKFNLSEIEVVNEWAIMSGIGLLFGAITRVPAGLLSDKIGRVKAFILAYFAYTISLIIILLFELDIMYIIGLSIIRFGLNLIAMTGRGVVSTSFRDTGFKNGLLSSMVGVGSFAGPALLAWVLDNYPPDYIIYVSLALVFLDLLVFSLLLGIIPGIFRKIAPDKEIDLNLKPILHPQSGRDYTVLHNRGVQEAIFLFFAAGIIFGLITSVYTIYGFNVLGMNLSYLGLIIGAGSLVQVIWAPIVGKLYPVAKDENMRLIGWVIISISTFILIFSSVGSLYFILGYFMLNLGNATFITMEITRLNKTVKVDQFSFVFGIMTSLIILGTALAGFTSPLFYGYSREGTFMGSFIFAIISLLVVVNSTYRIKHQRSVKRF